MTLSVKIIKAEVSKIIYKVVSLQRSWIKRLYDNNSHNRKIIPLYLITQKLVEKFLFHSNLHVNPKQINHFPQYYQEIFRKWSSNLSVSPNIPSTIGQGFNENRMAKAWLDIKMQFNLSNKQHCFWIQLINAISKSWKEELRRNNCIPDALSVYDHHLIKKKSNIFFR